MDEIKEPTEQDYNDYYNMKFQCLALAVKSYHDREENEIVTAANAFFNFVYDLKETDNG